MQSSIFRVKAAKLPGTRACPGCGKTISANKRQCFNCSQPATCCGRHALEGRHGQPCGGVGMPPERLVKL